MFRSRPFYEELRELDQRRSQREEQSRLEVSQVFQPIQKPAGRMEFHVPFLSCIFLDVIWAVCSPTKDPNVFRVRLYRIYYPYDLIQLVGFSVSAKATGVQLGRMTLKGEEICFEADLRRGVYFLAGKVVEERPSRGW